MSAQQVKALFDHQCDGAWAILLQRISETWRVNEARTATDLVRSTGWSLYVLGILRSSMMLSLNILAEQHEMVANPYMMQFYKELLPSLRRSYFLTLNTSTS